MFRRLTMAIFRMYMKYLVSSSTRLIWAVYSGEVRVEVGTRSRMCHRGWVGWVHGDSDKICRETQNTRFMINNVHPKDVSIMRQCKRFWQRHTKARRWQYNTTHAHCTLENWNYKQTQNI